MYRYSAYVLCILEVYIFFMLCTYASTNFRKLHLRRTLDRFYYVRIRFFKFSATYMGEWTYQKTLSDWIGLEYQVLEIVLSIFFIPLMLKHL